MLELSLPNNQTYAESGSRPSLTVLGLGLLCGLGLVGLPSTDEKKSRLTKGGLGLYVMSSLSLKSRSTLSDSKSRVLRSSLPSSYEPLYK